MNVYVRDFSRALGQRGLEVDVFTRAQSVVQAGQIEQLGERVRVIHMPAGPLAPLPVGEIGRHLDEFASGVLGFAQQHQLHYDLIHSHYWLSGMVAGRLRNAWGGMPFVQMFHTLGHMKNRVAQQESERAPQERLDGERWVVAQANHLIAPTVAERTQLVELYGACECQISVIPPGVDLERFYGMEKEQARAAAGVAHERANILFAGRIEPLKGIDTLIEATALLRQQQPDVMAQTRVTIIGGDPRPAHRNAEMARLQQLRCQLDLCDLVGFVGAKEQSLLPYFFAAADMVVMPSHYESFGLVALEAMATGTPVVASGVGGLAHLVEDGRTGFHVPPRDPAALAERMGALLADADLRRQLGAAGRRRAHQYDWAHIVDRMMEEVYRPLVAVV
jgi:D-inositol-3-phosphate glycosyltransferase